MRLTAFLLTTVIASVAVADDHGMPRPGEGAFVALMVQAKDPDAYIEVMKENTAPFEALGSSVAGACVTKTGADIRGRCSYGMRLIPWSKRWCHRCLRPHESARRTRGIARREVQRDV